MEARGKTKGVVYIIQSECIHIPDGDKCFCPVKIGSAIDWETRIGNLDGAVPIDFKVYMLIECEDCRGLETAIHNHKELNKLKVGQRGKKNTEFFRVSVKEAKRIARECAIEYAKINGIAKPVIKTKIPQLGRSASSIKKTREKLYGGAIEFTCDVPGGGEAYGHFIDRKRFVVKANSRIRRVPAPSFATSRPPQYYKTWCTICNGDFLDEDGKLKSDYVFDSRAAATSVVCASNRNGDKEWVDKKNGWKLGAYFGRLSADENQ